MSILVREVMVRDVAYVTIPGSRDDVLRTLQEHKVSGVPVIKKGEVVGMITRRDLLRNREEDQTALLMTRNAVVISPDKTVVEAAELLLKEGKEALKQVEELAQEKGVAFESLVIEGNPGSEIISYAESAGMDIIILGAVGRTGLDKFLLGSVAEKVVRNSKIPVLTIPREQA